MCDSRQPADGADSAPDSATMLESDFEAMVEKSWRVLNVSGIHRTREQVRASMADKLAKRGTTIVPDKL